MEVDQNSSSRGDGFKSYYTTKIEELLLVVAEKSMNLRRLQAQRNELNAKGMFLNIIIIQILPLCQIYKGTGKSLMGHQFLFKN